jgi:hypothetical protein
MKRALLALAAVALVAGAPVQAADDVSVSVDRTAVSTRIGHTFVFHSTIANRSAAPARRLVAHLNIVDLSGNVYVDPEDWSSHRTRYLMPIPAGGSTTVAWKLNAVNAGTIGVYVAVLPRSGAPVPPTTGPTVHVSIRERRTLNSGGILPLALGIPSLIGAAALGVRFRRRGSEGGTS